MDEPIEAEAVEVGRTQPGAGLVTRAEASVLRPLDVNEVKSSMESYQRGLASILDASDWQTAGDGRFVKKSGWRKIATWFGLSVEIVRERIERDEQGEPLRASVVVKAIAPNGRSMDGDGHCASSEPRFNRQGGRQKLENDLIGTATTRAKNRAIADLVGMGAVSAEEVDANGAAPSGPPFGEAASEELEERLTKALLVLVGPDKIASVVSKIAEDAGGYLPRISARAVLWAMSIRLAETAEQDQAEQPDEPNEAEQGVTDGDDEGAESDAEGGVEGADAGGEGSDGEPEGQSD